MKFSKIILALIIGSYVLSSCKKEALDDSMNGSNYHIAKIDISSREDINKIINPFPGEYIEFKLDVDIREEIDYANTSPEDEDFKTKNIIWMTMSPKVNCRVYANKKVGPCQSVPWEEGEQIEAASTMNWRLVSMMGGLYDNEDKIRLFLIECEIDNTIKYGWVKLTKDYIELVIPKKNYENFKIGIKE